MKDNEITDFAQSSGECASAGSLEVICRTRFVAGACRGLRCAFAHLVAPYFAAVPEQESRQQASGDRDRGDQESTKKTEGTEYRTSGRSIGEFLTLCGKKES